MNELQVANPAINIDPDDVLREYGLDSIEQTSTVIQRGDDTVSITPVAPTTTTETLVSPSISVDTDFNEFIEETFSEAVAEEEAIVEREAEVAAVSNEAPSLNDLVEAVEPPKADIDKLSSKELIELLPENSKSFEIDESTSRFSGAEWYKEIQKTKVLLAGLGGIGSYVLFCLSRMKPEQILLYDDDVVETANLSGQLYSSTMVGRTKVEAMAKLAEEFSMYHDILAVPQKFTKDTEPSDIMICGFDNMEARKDFFNSWVKHILKHPHPENCLYIDGRLNMEEFQVFCMRGDDKFNINKYNEEYLFNNHEAESVQCSMKQTTYCSNMIGSVIVNLFTNFVANKLNPIIARDLPFKTYYSASMMYFKTEL